MEYIQLLVKALGVKPEDFEKFISGIQGNNELKEILANNFEKFFWVNLWFKIKLK